MINDNIYSSPYFQNISLVLGQSGKVGQDAHYARWPFTRYVRFSPPFRSTPSLVYGFVHLDAHPGHLRAQVYHGSLTRRGFRITLRQWADTRLIGLHVTWMACPK